MTSTPTPDLDPDHPTPTGPIVAVHPEPFDSAAFGRYAQDRLRDAASAAARSR